MRGSRDRVNVVVELRCSGWLYRRKKFIRSLVVSFGGLTDNSFVVVANIAAIVNKYTNI